MNNSASASIKGPNPPKSETYAKVRSQCVDAFARLEFAIIAICARLNLKLASRALVGQRVKRLKEPATIASLPKLDRDGAIQLLETIEAILRERTDIVHAEMIVAHTDSETMAIFRNSADRAEGKPEARVYSLKSLRALCESVCSLAERLDNLAKADMSATQPAAKSS